MNSLIQYKKFPSSRYMGSKNKIIKNLYEVFNNYKFDSVLDPFSGSACVSYLLKSMGKKVISNDYMSFASNISKAIIGLASILSITTSLSIVLGSTSKVGTHPLFPEQYSLVQ